MAFTFDCNGRGRLAACLTLIGLLAWVLTRPASASLGDDLPSVEADRASMKATLRRAHAALYEIHEMVTPQGTTVREFASLSGKVFAVTWKGPFKPDLRQTLGSYFETYRAAPRVAGSTRSHASVAERDLVVHAMGHMRSFVGLAYVPSLVPAGVSPNELL
jgi:hypothetical protein